MNNSNGVTGPPKVNSTIAPVAHRSPSATNINMNCPTPSHADTVKNAGSSWFSSMSPGSDNVNGGSGITSSGSALGDNRPGSALTHSSSSSGELMWLLGTVLAVFAAGWASHSWYINNMSGNGSAGQSAPSSPGTELPKSSPAGSPRPLSARPM